MIAYKVVRTSGRKKLSAIIQSDYIIARCVSYYLNKKTISKEPTKPLFCFRTINYAKDFAMDRSSKNWLNHGESLVVYECEIKVHEGYTHQDVRFAQESVAMILADEVTLKKVV